MVFLDRKACSTRSPARHETIGLCAFLLLERPLVVSGRWARPSGRSDRQSGGTRKTRGRRSWPTQDVTRSLGTCGPAGSGLGSLRLGNAGRPTTGGELGRRRASLGSLNASPSGRRGAWRLDRRAARCRPRARSARPATACCRYWRADRAGRIRVVAMDHAPSSDSPTCCRGGPMSWRSAGGRRVARRWNPRSPVALSGGIGGAIALGLADVACPLGVSAPVAVERCHGCDHGAIAGSCFMNGLAAAANSRIIREGPLGVFDGGDLADVAGGASRWPRRRPATAAWSWSPRSGARGGHVF